MAQFEETGKRQDRFPFPFVCVLGFGGSVTGIIHYTKDTRQWHFPTSSGFHCLTLDDYFCASAFPSEMAHGSHIETEFYP